MSHHNKTKQLYWIVAAAFAPFAVGHAADAGADKQLGEMVVTSGKTPVPANLPAVSEGVSAAQIEETVNAVTAAETIKYLPSMVVRERFIGDRNAIIATRTTGTLSSAQSLLYGDDMMLSNLLGNSYNFPPRWGMVGPDEISRVDVIYGPFSALYPGNSMGGVVLMTTRMPKKFEAHVNVQAFQEDFKLYGTNEHNNGSHLAAALGNRSGDWSWWASADHLDAHGHPMSYATASKSGAGTTAVSGAFLDKDPNGAARVITGGYGIDHTIQDNGKIKLAYAFSPTVSATYTLGIWQNRSDTGVETFLRDAAGNPVYNNGNLKINGTNYSVSGLNPGHAESEHWMQGLALRTDTHGELDWDAAISNYDYRKDISRAAANYGNNNTGTIQFMDGTGWDTLDLKADWHPGKGDHQVTFGYHYDKYVLSSLTYNTADWRNGPSTTLSTSSVGDTQTQALFAQDSVRLMPDWRLTLGGRYEKWRAFGGANYTAALGSKSYADREASFLSPKASLSCQLSPEWALRGSWGKAYRFPTVSELFQTTKVGATTTLQNDPNLKPEQVSSTDITIERGVGESLVRLSFFDELKRNALYSQTDTTVTPNITSVQNIDRVRTDGLQLAAEATDAGLRGLDLSGSVTYAKSKVLQDDRCPACVNGNQPRIPDWRGTLVATYHRDDRLSYTAAARYSGRMNNTLPNTDINPDTYGGTSKYFIVDAKVHCKLDKQWSASAGVDNLNNYRSFVAHPNPQRTLIANLKFDY